MGGQRVATSLASYIHVFQFLGLLLLLKMVAAEDANLRLQAEEAVHRQVLDRTVNLSADMALPPDVQTESESNGKEQYLVPIISHYVGHGNQAVEFASSLVMARILKRTLCLSKFQSGPMKHYGKGVGDHWGLDVVDVYDVQYLQRFAKVLPIGECLRRCGAQLDVYIKLRGLNSPSLFRDWDPVAPYQRSYEFKWDYLTWTSPRDVVKSMGIFSEERCVGIAGMFPGLRWQGAYDAVAPFIRPTLGIQGAADALRAAAFGDVVTPILAVHWRFEESLCSNQVQGLCFPRCKSGALPSDPNSVPAAQPWVDFRANNSMCPIGQRWSGTIATQEDIVAAIVDKAQATSLRHVYIATDGWIRTNGCEILEQVVGELRQQSYQVAGTWQCPKLPALSIGPAPSTEVIGSWLGLPGGRKASNHAVSLVEQELARRATVFIGSGMSSWTIGVARARRGAVAAQQALESFNTPRSPGWPVGVPRNETLEALVIDKLMQDDHMASMICRGSQLGRRYGKYYPALVSNDPPIDAQSGNDGWLDLLACEKREGVGHCQMAKCWAT